MFSKSLSNADTSPIRSNNRLAPVSEACRVVRSGLVKDVETIEPCISLARHKLTKAVNALTRKTKPLHVRLLHLPSSVVGAVCCIYLVGAIGREVPLLT